MLGRLSFTEDDVGKRLLLVEGCRKDHTSDCATPHCCTPESAEAATTTSCLSKAHNAKFWLGQIRELQMW